MVTKEHIDLHLLAHGGSTYEMYDIVRDECKEHGITCELDLDPGFSFWCGDLQFSYGGGYSNLSTGDELVNILIFMREHIFKNFNNNARYNWVITPEYLSVYSINDPSYILPNQT